MSFCVFSNSFNKKGEDSLLLSEAVTASIKDLTGLYRRTLFPPARSIQILFLFWIEITKKSIEVSLPIALNNLQLAKNLYRPGISCPASSLRGSQGFCLDLKMAKNMAKLLSSSYPQPTKIRVKLMFLKWLRKWLEILRNSLSRPQNGTEKGENPSPPFVSTWGKTISLTLTLLKDF